LQQSIDIAVLSAFLGSQAPWQHERRYFWMMASGVFKGATMTPHPVAKKSGIVSDRVGKIDQSSFVVRLNDSWAPADFASSSQLALIAASVVKP
jgi:hypothetical protein